MGLMYSLHAARSIGHPGCSNHHRYFNCRFDASPHSSARRIEECKAQCNVETSPQFQRVTTADAKVSASILCFFLLGRCPHAGRCFIAKLLSKMLELPIILLPLSCCSIRFSSRDTRGYRKSCFELVQNFQILIYGRVEPFQTQFCRFDTMIR